MFYFKRNSSHVSDVGSNDIEKDVGSPRRAVSATDDDEVYDEVSLEEGGDDSGPAAGSRGLSLRRRPGHDGLPGGNSHPHHGHDKKKASKSTVRFKRKGSWFFSRTLLAQDPLTLRRNFRRVSLSLNRMATVILCVSFLLWFTLVILLPDDPSSSSILFFLSTPPPDNANINGIQQDRDMAREQKRLERLERIERRKGQAKLPGVERNKTAHKLTTTKHKRKGSVEDLPSDCYRPDWQLYNFPNCNDVHDIDLRDVRERQKYQPESNVGLLASGMWRTVWAVDPQLELVDDVTTTINKTRAPLAAMKVMKEKFDVEDRNFDRHRRDALTMERLTSSPYVVDIFGFCGNTVLTEFIEKPLDDLIEDSLYNETGSYPSILNARDRIRMALDVARGLQAMHDIQPGGPIVHADIQERQFLVAPNGVVKVNDFNRCRIMALHEKDDSPCTFKIPQAPGKHRSPEEYEYADLDEKLDVYSAANVLFSILTGVEAWSEYSKTETQSMVKKGVKPAIAPEFRNTTADEILAELTERAYEVDPRKRISASEIVRRLEELLASDVTIPATIDRPIIRS